MKHASRIVFVASAATIQLLVSGCGGGGGASGFFSGLFGGGSDTAGILGSFASAGGELLGDGGDTGGEGGVGGGVGGGLEGSGGGAGEIATVHHPEPGSVALFGGGLACTAILSRRRRKSRAKRSS